MANDLLHFYNLDPDDTLEESLRLALMFKEEVDEATRAYMEMLHLAIDTSDHSPDQINNLVEEAINAALVTGIRAYRNFVNTQGINVTVVEENSGKDIPLDYFHKDTHWIQ